MRSYSTLFAVTTAIAACLCAGMASAVEVDRKIESNRVVPQDLSKSNKRLATSSESEPSLDGLKWDGLNTKGGRSAARGQKSKEGLPKNVPAELR